MEKQVSQERPVEDIVVSVKRIVLFHLAWFSAVVFIPYLAGKLLRYIDEVRDGGACWNENIPTWFIGLLPIFAVGAIFVLGELIRQAVHSK